MSLYDEILIAPNIETQALTNGTVNGLDVDRSPANGPAYQDAIFYIDVGLWTDGTHTFKIEEAPDNAGSPGTYVDPDAAELVGGATLVISDATNDEGQHVLGYRGKERFIRLTVTTTGATTGLADVEAHSVLGDPDQAPVR